MRTHVLQGSSALAGLVARLNGTVAGSMGLRCGGVLWKVVRACAESDSLSRSKLYVAKNLTKREVAFSADPEDKLFDPRWSSRDIVMVHGCEPIHLPFLLGEGGVSGKELYELCRLIIDRGGDVDAVASQKLVPLCDSEMQGVKSRMRHTEHTSKTAIFYAIEKKCPQMVRTLIDLGANCHHGMCDTYGAGENVIPVVYATRIALGGYNNGDHGNWSELLEIMNMLLENTGVGALLEHMRHNAPARDAVLDFVTLLNLEMELNPGSLMEPVGGEYLRVLELFLRCNERFVGELSGLKSTHKYRDMSRKVFSRSRQAAKISSSPASEDESSHGVTPLGSVDKPLLPSKAYTPVARRNMVSCPENSLGEQLLSMAAYYGCVGVVRWLLREEGVNVNADNLHGFTPVHCAAKSNNVEIVGLLLDAGAFTSRTKIPYSNVGHTAALSGSTDVLQFLQARCPDVLLEADCDGWSVMHYAASCADNNLEMMKYIVENVTGLDPDSRVNGAWGYESMIAELGRWGGSISDVQKEKILSHIYKRSKRPDGRTALYIAVESGNVKMAKFLIENSGCDPNAASAVGFTALNVNAPKTGTIMHLAVKAQDFEFVKRLLGYKGINLNARSDGKTPMDVAIDKGDRFIINLLLADPRQSLTTIGEDAEVPYSRILTSMGLLDSEGKNILLCRARLARGFVARTRGKLITVSVFFATIATLVAVSMAVFEKEILEFFAHNFVSTLNMRVLVAGSAIVILIAVVVIIVGIMWMSDRARCKRDAEFLLSASRESRSPGPQLGHPGDKYVGHSYGRRKEHTETPSAGSYAEEGYFADGNESLGHGDSALVEVQQSMQVEQDDIPRGISAQYGSAIDDYPAYAPDHVLTLENDAVSSAYQEEHRPDLSPRAPAPSFM
ncbi:MAG: ankyrin repeat domain-containing protein [Anaplasma sp.]